MRRPLTKVPLVLPPVVEDVAAVLVADLGVVGRDAGRVQDDVVIPTTADGGDPRTQGV